MPGCKGQAGYNCQAVKVKQTETAKTDRSAGSNCQVGPVKRAENCQAVQVKQAENCQDGPVRQAQTARLYKSSRLKPPR